MRDDFSPDDAYYSRPPRLACRPYVVAKQAISNEEASKQIEAIMNSSDEMVALVGEKVATKYKAKMIENIIDSIV